MGIRGILTVAASLVTLLAVAGVRVEGDQHTHGSRSTAARRVTPMKAHRGALPALPGLSVEPVRPMPVVQAAYEFAARHPEILQYVPCYCGCERDGHGGSHDCFIAARAADGRVVEWNTHGLGCAICIDVARDAQALFEAGRSPVEIRAAIDAAYARFPSSTPTPRPRR
jgi:hypothetical protein